MNGWQTSRAQLNHDLLKNQWLLWFGRLERTASGEVRGAPQLWRTEMAAGLIDFGELLRELANLIDTAATSMSPAVLFDYLPLRACDFETRAWLTAFSHGLWKHSQGLEKKIASARQLVLKVDEERHQLSQLLAENSTPGQTIAHEIHSLRLAAFALSEAINALPSAILVL